MFFSLKRAAKRKKGANNFGSNTCVLYFHVTLYDTMKCIPAEFYIFQRCANTRPIHSIEGHKSFQQRLQFSCQFPFIFCACPTVVRWLFIEIPGRNSARKSTGFFTAMKKSFLIIVSLFALKNKKRRY